jgi:uncharacterized protein YoaH (UPF0181 family)
MSMALDDLVLAAQAQLEAALRGASLCSVSRDPRRGASDVKLHEGRWYTLRDIQRLLATGEQPGQAVDAVSSELRRRTPAGEAWASYLSGGEQALREARTALDLTD